MAGRRRLRHARGRDQLLAGRVHADHQKAVVRGMPVDIQHVLPVVHEGGVGLREDAPALLLPQLQRVF